MFGDPTMLDCWASPTPTARRSSSPPSCVRSSASFLNSVAERGVLHRLHLQAPQVVRRRVGHHGHAGHHGRRGEVASLCGRHTRRDARLHRKSGRQRRAGRARDRRSHDRPAAAARRFHSKIRHEPRYAANNGGFGGDTLRGRRDASVDRVSCETGLLHADRPRLPTPSRGVGRSVD